MPHTGRLVVVARVSHVSCPGRCRDVPRGAASCCGAGWSRAGSRLQHIRSTKSPGNIAGIYRRSLALH